MRIKKTSQYIEGGAGLPSYFTTETDTGMKWIDGKTIYRKVINIGNLASSSTTTNYDIGFAISGVTFTNIIVIAQSSGASFTIPWTNASNSSQNIEYYMTGNDIAIITHSDRSAYKAFAILEYTKN